MQQHYLAIDLGASSGRAVVGTLDGDEMRMQEVHRFETPTIEANGHMYWDLESLWGAIQQGVANAFACESSLRSISIDSWAVDYVPLDRNGKPLRNAYCYRDPRAAGCLEQAVRLVGGADALYEQTGIQFLTFNTLPQVMADLRDEADVVQKTATRLFIAEYFLYRLSGSMVAEATMASTSQLVDASTGQWSQQLISAIGDDSRRWPSIVQCGTPLGPMQPALVPSAAQNAPIIIASCTHDTAAAVAAVPASSTRPWAYISSGTWSLVGAELATPLLTREAREAGYTNEAGLDGTVRFLTNRAGMFVLEECRREWASDHGTRSHQAIFAAAEVADSLGTIDLNADPFAARGDMIGKIRSACLEHGLRVPETEGEIARVILESLAASHAAALHRLDELTGTRADDVHIVGGGSLADMLNQLTADYSGRRVLAGPSEATILGNLLSQARSMGDLPAGVSIRDAARRSTGIKTFSAQRGAMSSAACSR